MQKDNATLYKEFLELYNQGNFEAALLVANKIIENDPEYAVAYTNRGIVYNNLGNYEAALKDHTKALSLDPEYAVAYNNRGGVYYNLGNNEAALEDYNKALSLDPEDSYAHLNKGGFYSEPSGGLGNNFPKAKKCYQKALIFAEKRHDYQVITNAYLGLFLLEYEKIKNRGGAWLYLQYFWVHQNYKTKDEKSLQPYRITLQAEDLKSIIEYLIEADKPLFASRFFEEAFGIQKLDDFNFISYKSLLADTFAQAEQFSNLFYHWENEYQNKKQDYDYYFYQALTWYYGGDNLKAYQILDDKEVKAKATDDFCWQYHLWQIGKAGCHLYHFQEEGKNHTQEDIRKELRNLNEHFEGLIETQKPDLKTFQGLHEQYYIGLYHFKQADYKKALAAFSTIPDAKYSQGLFRFCPIFNFALCRKTRRYCQARRNFSKNSNPRKSG